MIIDCHVHISACTPAHGFMSRRLMDSLPFRFMRWRFGLVGEDEHTERALESKLIETIDGSGVDAVTLLAFDGVYDDGGNFDPANTHLYVTNDYVIDLARHYPTKVLFGASIHPYCKDALNELERCVAAGAVLVKWLPITQGMNPADPRCIPFYEAMAHHKVPLLCHTGGERSLPRVDDSLADPKLLAEAIRRGVTVIAAHCGTRSVPTEPDYLADFVRLAQEHEHFYGDTSALNLPTRAHAYDAILANPRVREKLLHGSDWPIIAIPPVKHVGWPRAFALITEKNWMKRDVMIKRQLGFDDAYWLRAATVLRMPSPSTPPLMREGQLPRHP
jgi:predicted TIM-barrel fold metal-dependent hydrolase